MAGDLFYQDLDPSAAPDPVTPADSPPGRPAEPGDDWVGGAPYDINAPQAIGGITAAFDAANALSGAGVIEPMGPRQQQTRELLDSPPGYGAQDILAGFPDYENNNVSPGADLEGPIQGEGGGYPGTVQDGIPMYPGPDHPLEGVAPETGVMGGAPGLGYPGTTQDGLPTYGT